MDGLLIIDKPAGITSHDVVARARRALRERRVGHTGTLDPMATGVLPLVVGRATRLSQFLTASAKEYEAAIRLGVATDTYDAAGRPVGAVYEGPFPARETIDRALDAFRGTFDQQPPAFSAKKIDGTRSYRLARRDARERPEVEAVAPAAVPVTAEAIEVLAVDDGQVRVRVVCSAGFYVRSLAHDLGRSLGTGAHLEALRRTRSGTFSLRDAVALGDVESGRTDVAQALVPLRRLLSELPCATLTPEGVEHAVHGRTLGGSDLAALEGAGPRVRLLDPSGELVGIASPAGAPALLHPSIILM
jgi:tRNA pseudouridine55 synthase